MIRLIVLLLIIAGVAGYFTRPEEPAMRAAADAVLNDPQDLSQGLETVGAAFAGNRVYNNYYVASKYTVTLDNRVLVECWGAFTQAQCNRPPAETAS
jgi:hypothetical protein